jgi:DNA-binding transcriptional ArsR family regulator
MPTDTLDATFAALADPTRRAILARLASGEASVAEYDIADVRPLFGEGAA